MPDAAATGSGETSGFVLGSLTERGHEKSSARPAGAAKLSPRLKTFAAIGSGFVCVETFPPRSSLPWSALEVSGNTGPTSGLVFADPDFGVVSGPGSATGAT